MFFTYFFFTTVSFHSAAKLQYSQQTIRILSSQHRLRERRLENNQQCLHSL